MSDTPGERIDAGDDSERLQALLREKRETEILEARWRNALENVGDGVWDWDLRTNEVYFSPFWKSMIGYADDEIENTYEEWRTRVHPDDLEAAERDIAAHVEGRTAEYRNQHRLKTKEGSWKWILDRGRIVERDAEGKPVRLVGTHTDLTEQLELQKELELSRRLLTRAQEMGRIGHWEVDFERGTASGSEVTRNIYGVSGKELPLDEVEKIPLPEYRPLLNEARRALIEEGLPYDTEYKLRRPDGTVLDVHSRAEYDREQNKLFGILQDITERKRAEEQILGLLREKELLLREVHHRVKNNLMLIISIISLQMSECVNEETVDALQELRGRVNGMQLIYDRLYRTSMYDKSGVREYLDELTGEISRSLLRSGGVRIDTEIEDINLDTPKLFPIGIIVNELVTNAIKHAFPGGRPGVIRVAVNRGEAGTVVLEVGDDGTGLAGEIDARKGGGFGLSMVRLMVSQVKGAIEIPPGERGTAWRITFPVSPGSGA